MAMHIIQGLLISQRIVDNSDVSESDLERMLDMTARALGFEESSRCEVGTWSNRMCAGHRSHLPSLVSDRRSEPVFGGRSDRRGEQPRHGHDSLVAMIDDVAKAHLHAKLRAVRQALVWKLDGVSEYDVRRPLTSTATNLLGLVKHNAISDARYFGDVFDRPFPEPLPRWDDKNAWGHWANEDETLDDIVDLYRRVWIHTDATIEALDLDSGGYVPWWDEAVPLFNVMVHRLSDATRHAGHADILREALDGAVGVDADTAPLHGRDRDYWKDRCAEVERIALAAAPPHRR